MPKERRQRYGKGHPYHSLPRTIMFHKAFYEAFALWDSGVRKFPKEINTSWAYGYNMFMFFLDIRNAFRKKGRIPNREKLKAELLNRQAILTESGKRFKGKELVQFRNVWEV